MTSDLVYQSASAHLTALKNNQLTSAELLEAQIARIEQCDGQINAVVVRDFASARLAAKAADAARARGEDKPLLGLPITVKESFNVKGLTTTWGNPAFKGWEPSQDALTIKRLKDAGAIIIGKTNVSMMLMDWQSYNPLYGTTNNPWQQNCTPGGSSGGAAAALAAGFTALELGSDLAGSLRTPAHYCGVYSHKPTLDLIPLRGAGAPGMPAYHTRVDLAVAGPMARSAQDLTLALQVLAGPDELFQGRAYQLTLPKPRQTSLAKYRVLVLKDHPLCPTEQAITQALAQVAARLTQAGASVAHETPALPDLANISQLFSRLLGAFTVGDMPIAHYEQLLKEARELSLADRSPEAHYVLGCALSHRDWIAQNRLRSELFMQWRQLYQTFDVILCPVMPTTAFTHEYEADFSARKLMVDKTPIAYADQSPWISIASLFGLPATVVPIGVSPAGLPIGMQVIGDYFDDMTTLDFAKQLEGIGYSFQPPPL